MAYEATNFDPGPNATVPAINDNLGVAGRAQAVKLLDPTANSTSPIGNDANPMRVRNRRRGVADYESGRVTVTDAAVQLTALTIYPEHGYVSNLTAATRWFQILDSNDLPLTGQLPVPANETRPWPITNQLVAPKIRAEANGAIVCGVWGGRD